MTIHRKVTLEQHKRFSESALWRMQRDYFEKEGINAWVSQVPFYITSNPFIAASYAKIAMSFMRDWIKAHPESAEQTFYFLELGTGSGRFSYLFVKALLALMKSLNNTSIRFCYVMTDFTKHNMQYWQSHDALKPYIEQGLIDFALYDMEGERPITLINQNKRLSSDLIKNPLIVFANYIFDTISHDAFTVHEGKLHELLYSLHTDESNIEHLRPQKMEKIEVTHNIREIKNAYYGDAPLDDLLEEYKAALHTTNFLIPIGAIRAIQYLRKCCNDRLLIISTDKGYSAIDQLDHLGHPTISFHSSFSMMVNFHAISEYLKKTGGDGYLQGPRKGIRTSVFSSSFSLNTLPETKTAIIDWVERLSPSDYFTLHSRVRDHFDTYDLETLASHLEFALWDPHVYSKLSPRIITLLNESPDPRTVASMVQNMPRLAAHYYHMPQSPCVLFDIGLFFETIKEYASAKRYYQEALVVCPDAPHIIERIKTLQN